MRWINFGILVYFLVRFAGPLVGQSFKPEVGNAAEYWAHPAGERQIAGQGAGGQGLLEKSGSRLEEIKNRIVELGERRKQEIIDEAQTSTVK
jgi:hypothetical protein